MYSTLVCTCTYKCINVTCIVYLYSKYTCIVHLYVQVYIHVQCCIVYLYSKYMYTVYMYLYSTLVCTYKYARSNTANLFPPSSNVTGVRFLEASAITSFPILVLPV